MTLSELIVCRRIAPSGPLFRDDVIRLSLEELANIGRIPHDALPALLRTVLQREELGTTGIGNGLAIPHARHAPLSGPVVSLVVVRQGVDFASLDGEPVYVVLLCLSPPPPRGMHAGQTMRPVFEILLRRLRQREFVQGLREAETAEDFATLLDASDTC